jgi:RNA polymerase sigma-70 factor (ECF subfamily)
MQNTQIAELVEKSKKKDFDAFGKLVCHFQPKIFAFTFRMICNEEDANDTVQEVFVKVWQNLEKYNPKFSFNTWLYAIATNYCIDFLRSAKKKQFLPLQEEHFRQFSINDADMRLNNKEVAEIITRITQNLSPKQRLVFTLKELEGLEVEEISAITHLSPEKIKSNLYLAKKFIRQQFNKIFKNESERQF